MSGENKWARQFNIKPGEGLHLQNDGETVWKIIVSDVNEWGGATVQGKNLVKRTDD